MKKYRVAIVGATGLVGRTILQVLEERKFPIEEIVLLASSRSKGSKVIFQKTEIVVKEISKEIFEGVDIAIFAGTEGEKGASVTFASEAIKRGAIVIDNSSDFRMNPNVPLVVPEVNALDISWHKGLIANPNCSTIQMVVVLKPIHDVAKIGKIIVSTYQSVSGSGSQGVKELEEQNKAYVKGDKDIPINFYQHQILFNVIPQIGGFREDDSTIEEWKMVCETHKILHDSSIEIEVTAVRVPVMIGHSEAIYIETEKEISPFEVKEILLSSKGVKVIQDGYPMPLFVSGKDDVFVGRVRRSSSVSKGISLWVVADNLRKGAATNAIQIAEEIILKN